MKILEASEGNSCFVFKQL